MCDPCLTSNVILTHPTPIDHRDCYHEPFSFDFLNQPAQNPKNLNTETIMNQSGKSLSTCIECILPETSKEELNKPQRTTMLHSKRFLKRQSRGRVLSNMVVILPRVLVLDGYSMLFPHMLSSYVTNDPSRASQGPVPGFAQRRSSWTRQRSWNAALRSGVFGCIPQE